MNWFDNLKFELDESGNIFVEDVDKPCFSPKQLFEYLYDGWKDEQQSKTKQ